MKKMENGIALAVAVVFTTALNVQAWFDPSTERWASRDPLEEDGGDNLYGFVANDGINCDDAFGLWQIKRNGGARADATPEEGDTVDGLAQIIHFDDKDYQVWLQPEYGSAMPDTPMEVISWCANYSIPNTIYFEDAPLLSWLDHFGPIPVWQSQFAKMASSFSARGFNVITRQPSNLNVAQADLADGNLFGWGFAGHGGGRGNLVFAPGQQTAPLIPQRYTRYGVSFLLALGCDTALQYPIRDPHHNLGYKFSEWEKNVAVRGNFEGVWGEVNRYNGNSHYIWSHGTNIR
jgi:hypothetical protein